MQGHAQPPRSLGGHICFHEIMLGTSDIKDSFYNLTLHVSIGFLGSCEDPCVSDSVWTGPNASVLFQAQCMGFNH